MSFWNGEDIGDYDMEDACGRCGHTLFFHGRANGGDFCHYLHGPRNACGCQADSDAFDKAKDARLARTGHGIFKYRLITHRRSR